MKRRGDEEERGRRGEAYEGDLGTGRPAVDRPDLVSCSLGPVPMKRLDGKELERNPSSTAALVTRYGPSTWQIIRCQELSTGHGMAPLAPMDNAGQVSLNNLLRNQPQIRPLPTKCTDATRGELKYPLHAQGLVTFEQAILFLPTAHLTSVFDGYRRQVASANSSQLFNALASRLNKVVCRMGP